MTQTTIQQSTDDAPEIGVGLDADDRTHYAHTRYAAAEMCEGYASAERKNAVTHRLEGDA